MRRGDVWWARLGGAAKTRPVVLLSRDEAYARRTHVTVAPVTSRNRGLASEVRLGPEDGLQRDSVVSLDGIVTIPKAQILDRISTLKPTKVRAIEKAIHFALDLSD